MNKMNILGIIGLVSMTIVDLYWVYRADKEAKELNNLKATIGEKIEMSDELIEKLNALAEELRYEDVDYEK